MASLFEVRGHRHGPGCGHSHLYHQAQERGVDHAADPLPVQGHEHFHGHGAVHIQGGGWVATLGTVSGVVCLIHCVLTPFLLSAVVLLPNLGLLAHGNLEHYLVGFTLLMAWSSVVLSYRSHRRRLSLYLLLTGTLLSAASQTLPDGTFVQTLLSLGGTGFLVTSIWVNRAHIRLGPPLPAAPLPLST